MSQRYLSSDPKTSNTAEPEIGGALRSYFEDDTAPSFREHLRLKLQDPFLLNENGGFRLSALWGGLGMIGGLAFLGFLYFNFVRL